MSHQPARWETIAARNTEHAETFLMKALHPALTELVRSYEAEIDRLRRAVLDADSLEQAKDRVL